jgi:membrane associated rhomboid family serine protease
MFQEIKNDDQPERPVDEQQAGVEPAEAQIEEHIDFPLYTAIIITGIVAVALAQFYTGLEMSVMLAGFVKPAFIADQEYWRILTGATLHGGLGHLALNSFAFYRFGKIFEMLAGRANLAITFLLAVLGGGLLSLIFAPEGASVGASGGVVGLIGYLLVYSYRRRQFITDEFRKSLLMNIGLLLLFGLVLYQVIDNYGHIGGLVTGAVYGFLQIPSAPTVDPRKGGAITEAGGLAALGIYLAACVFSILLLTRVV